jgi:hypothetical protein
VMPNALFQLNCAGPMCSLLQQKLPNTRALEFRGWVPFVG